MKILQAALVQNCELMTLAGLIYNVKLWYLELCNPFRDTVYVEMFLIEEVPENSREVLDSYLVLLLLLWWLLFATAGIRVSGWTELYSTRYGHSLCSYVYGKIEE